MIDEYPVPASLNKQKELLSSISVHIVTPFERTIQLEQKRMQDTCSLADIDFEFVLDSSGSIGPIDWGVTTDLIAQHWIRDTIQPSGSAQCGNHVAIRRYSSSHSYDLDFTPTNDWNLNGFTNYTEYVADVFTNLAHMARGTDTAGALERVRTEDLIKTRNGTTYVMVFTDGESNEPPDTVDQAELLHPLVDEVFAFGIGTGIVEEELEAIASKQSHMDIMENVQSYEDYISQFILKHGGCNTRQIRPYRAIDFNGPSLTSGLSWQTALNANLPNCDESSCPHEAEMDRTTACAEVEFEIDPFDQF